MKFRKSCQKAAMKAERKAAGTTTQKKAKKVSMASKKASTGIKKAA